ncbi:MAG: hypothetical protein ABFD25_10035 [Clostridiaceae bacterium]
MNQSGEKSLTDLYVERRERIAKRNKIIGITVVFLVLFAVIFRIGYKLYRSIDYNKTYYQSQVENTDYMLADEFDRFLIRVDDIAANLIFDIEFDREYQKGLLTGSRENIDNLERISVKKEYHLDESGVRDFPSLRDFLSESSYCVYQLIDEKELSEEQKEYLANIHNTYKKLRNLRIELLKEYWDSNGPEKDKIYERLFYDGQYVYNYVNKAYQIIDGITISVPTAKSREQEQRSREYSQEQVERFNNAMSRSEAKEYASDVYRILFGEPAELTEKGVRSENYDIESGTGSVFNDNSGQYLIGVDYTAKHFDPENQYINIGLPDGYFNYVHTGHKAEKELSGEELEKMANEIISSFKCGFLKKINANENERSISSGGNARLDRAITFTYRVEDDTYIDERQYVTIDLYMDGILRSLNFSSPDLFYGTYNKSKPAIDMETAKKSIDPEFHKNIEGWKLICTNELYYQFTVNKYGSRFFINVDAGTGKLKGVSEAS